MNKTTITVQDWIDALESGSYRQTRGELYNGNNYCCLGGEVNSLQGLLVDLNDTFSAQVRS